MTLWVQEPKGESVSSSIQHCSQWLTGGICAAHPTALISVQLEVLIPKEGEPLPEGTVRVFLNYKLWLSFGYFKLLLFGNQQVRKGVKILEGIIYLDHKEEVGLLLQNGKECVKLSWSTWVSLGTPLPNYNGMDTCLKKKDNFQGLRFFRNDSLVHSNR